MTYKLTPLDNELDKFAKKENYVGFKPSERMRCMACNSVYWRLFYDRAQCMGCKSLTRFEVEPVSRLEPHFDDLRAVTWVKWGLSKFPDGRVRDPLRRRSEFVIYKNILRCRVGGTELIIHPQLKGYWYYGKLKEEYKTMSPSQILAHLKASSEGSSGTP